LTAEEEDTHNIAQANIKIKSNGELESEDKVKARFEGDFPVVEPKRNHLYGCCS
jgi:DNA-directed RNA polymerase subunit beta